MRRVLKGRRRCNWNGWHRRSRRIRRIPLNWKSRTQEILVDTRPLILAVAQQSNSGGEAGQMARRFHLTLVEIICKVCLRLRELRKINSVTLSGGVFLNVLLTNETIRRLEQKEFRVYSHRQVPAGDGGLSLGQLAVAANQLANLHRSR